MRFCRESDARQNEPPGCYPPLCSRPNANLGASKPPMRETSGKASIPAGNISRRALLSGAGAAFLISYAPWQAARARQFDLAWFVRRSEKLTDHSNLPPETAKHYFRSIFRPNPGRRKALTEDSVATLDARIVADWYSGQTVGAAGMVCVDYTGALLWDAIGFAKPRGVPDAEAGRWAHAPF